MSTPPGVGPSRGGADGAASGPGEVARVAHAALLARRWPARTRAAHTFTPETSALLAWRHTMRPQLRLVPQPRGAQGAALKRKLTSAAAEAARAAAAEACVDAGRALLERLLTKVRARPAPREGAPGQRRQPGSAATTLLPPTSASSRSVEGVPVRRQRLCLPARFHSAPRHTTPRLPPGPPDDAAALPFPAYRPVMHTAVRRISAGWGRCAAPPGFARALPRARRWRPSAALRWRLARATARRQRARRMSRGGRRWRRRPLPVRACTPR